MKKQLLWVLSVIALASCGGDDETAVTPQPQPQERRMLTIEVSENAPQADASSRAFAHRRASVTSTSELSPFNMSAYDWYQVFSKTGSSWTSVYWPSQYLDKSIAFYAHKGGTFQWNSGSPYLSFSMGNQAATQTDLLVATDNTSYNARSGRVRLAFDHACAAVQFHVYKEEASSFVVKSIVLKGVKTEGEYHFGDKSWKNLAQAAPSVYGPYEYTLNTGDVTPTTTPQLLPCGWLFVIPQSKDGIQIKVTYTKDSGAEKIKTLSLPSGSWAAGYQYTVEIKIGK